MFERLDDLLIQCPVCGSILIDNDFCPDCGYDGVDDEDDDDDEDQCGEGYNCPKCGNFIDIDNGETCCQYCDHNIMEDKNKNETNTRT